uniref:Small ribosomal subunit protein uS15m n=1 Tax=Clastoptera arizonana TaxID=38151 RepID=A0A1B6DDL5_9HEMI
MALYSTFNHGYSISSRNLYFMYKIVRSLKSDLKIKWIRPEPVSCLKPEKSGDLKPREQIDPKSPLLELKTSDELQKSNELVKRIFSLEFNPRRYGVKFSLENSIDSVKRHKLDRSSPESQIAGLTATIRQLQEHVEIHRMDVRNKVILKELIDKRRRKLRLFRGLDYKRYEWLLEKLDIEYKPKPEIDERVERKKSLRKLTDLYCEEVRDKKLTEYKGILQSQQEEFLLSKAEKLKWIMKVENELQAEPSVTEEDINAVYEKLNMLKLNLDNQSEV